MRAVCVETTDSSLAWASPMYHERLKLDIRGFNQFDDAALHGKPSSV